MAKTLPGGIEDTTALIQAFYVLTGVWLPEAHPGTKRLLRDVTGGELRLIGAEGDELEDGERWDGCD